MDLSSMLRRLREVGWMVAVHNDYRQNGSLMTFWLFTHPNGTYLKAEGPNDEDAVGQIIELATGSLIQST